MDEMISNISLKQIQEQNRNDRIPSWIVLYGQIYDITSFITLHLGFYLI